MMDLSEISLGVLDMRDAVIIAITLVAIYLILSTVRLTQVSRKTKGKPKNKAIAVNTDKDAPSQAQPVAKSLFWKKKPQPQQQSQPRPQSQPTNQFEQELFRSGVEAELQRLRDEVVMLRGELDRMKTARRVSPQYNEAMMLAQNGLDALGIATQLGISVSEAELVLAMSRNQQEYKNHGGEYEVQGNASAVGR